MKEIDIINKVRNNRVEMTITQASPDERFHVAFLRILDFKDAKKTIVNAGKVLITWDRTPIIKPQSELAPRERPAKDNPWGWAAWVITDTTIEHGADIMIFLKRPTNAENKYRDKEMSAIAKKGGVLQSQLVYLELRIQVKTAKLLINALDDLKPTKGTRAQVIPKIKRALICGRDQTQYRMVDLLEGLSEAEIASFVVNLTPSQESFILKYCRHIFNDIGILQGPAGSGKMSIIKTIVLIANKRGLKVAIVTDSNFAADNVIDVIADSAYIAVRLHALGKH